jgi:hypothetical protein
MSLKGNDRATYRRLCKKVESSPIFLFPFQLLINAAKHLQDGLEVVGNLPGQDFRLREVLQVFQTVVFEPEDIQAGLVPLDYLLIGEGPEALELLALVPVLRIIALDEVLQVGITQGIGFQSEVLMICPPKTDPHVKLE